MVYFLIKAGYDSWRKQILNVSLYKNDIWDKGTILLNNQTNFWKINSAVNNKVEIIRNNDIYALLLNGMIVYENPKLFKYEINLFFKTKTHNFEEKNVYHYLDYKHVNTQDIYTINNLRQLN
jgi:hypothetical protein